MRPFPTPRQFGKAKNSREKLYFKSILLLSTVSTSGFFSTNLILFSRRHIPAIAFTISILINLFGNILVCFVVLKFRDMRIPMNYLLVNLAISDMMVGFFISPRFIFGRMLNHPGGTLGDYFCKILTGDSFTWTGALASDVTLVCIAVERYLSIRFPHSNKKRLTTKKLRYVIPLCWTFALGVNLPPFFYLKYDKNSGSCVPFWPTPNFIKYHSVINTHIFFVFPVLIDNGGALHSSHLSTLV